MSEEKPDPRRHHYVFAHRAMPSVFLRMPRMVMFRLLTLEDPTDFMRGYWAQIGEDVVGDVALDPDGLEVEVVRHANDFVAVVTMPPAKELAEAQMFALVLRTRDGVVDPGFEGPGVEPEDGAVPLYYTLEYGLGVDFMTPRTVFCRWDEGKHYNYGDGPPAEVGPFLQAIFERLEEDGPLVEA